MDLMTKPPSHWQNLVTKEQFLEIDASPRERKLHLLCEYSKIKEPILLDLLRKQYDLIPLDNFEIQENPKTILPLRVMLEYQCLPIEGKGETLNLITSWPPNKAMDRWIFSINQRRVVWFISKSSLIQDAINKEFGVGSGSLEESIKEDSLDSLEEELDDFENEDAAVIRFVNEVVQRAVIDSATDIHFEPEENGIQIRYRIDGDLVPISLPLNLVQFKEAIVSRIKIMAKLNISEKRRPQDGRINFKTRDADFDVRISTFPTLYGESISLRILNQKTQPLSIRDLGMLPQDEISCVSALLKPHGILLTTGPTGSGKSTTLSAFMRKINQPHKRIMTIEDPIEYEISKINQTQVNPDIGLSFASALRHILRQDPDVIMVGEIRDQETAEIAIRASLTGHLVLSTLHTNDASGAINRLIDMEIEPFLIASSIEMVIAQRLIRRLCKSCAEVAGFSEAYVRTCLDSIGIQDSFEVSSIFAHKGCDQCRNSGYKGRLGVYEILIPNERVKEMIVQNASAKDIHNEAIKNGMRTLQSCSWEQVKLGNTSMEELMKLDLKLNLEENSDEKLDA